jgi:MFS family permease
MLRSPLLPIFLTVFVDVLGLTLVLPLLPFYAEHFGASPFVVGALAASYAACQLVSGPVLGRISDRVGRKPTLLVSQLGTLAGFATIGFASSLWMLFAGRIIDGLTAGNLSIAQAYISDVTKPENRTKAFALIGIAFGTGFLFGPAVSGFLAKRYGFSAPAFAAAALSFCSILLTAIVLPEAKRQGEGPSEAGPTPPAGERNFDFGNFFRRPLPRTRLIQMWAFTLAFATLIGGLALFLERRFSFDVERTGYVYALSGFVGLIVQGGLIGRLVKRLGEERLALIGFISMALGYGLLSLSHDLPELICLVIVSGFGSAVVRPCMTTLLTKSVGRHEQGAALGLSQSLQSVSQIVGPLTAGWLINQHYLGAYALTASAFAVIGAGLLSRGKASELVPA